jgi:catechol 2,3-dioxygenase-like lactoylglutathione lyase family enzyme
VAVDDLDRAVNFYNTLFATRPSVLEHDYAKWMLVEPRANFAISARGRRVGLDHLGIQVDSDEELGAVAQALGSAGERIVEEQGATCCYARGNKAWVADPAGILWETFHTLGGAPSYGEDNASADALIAAPTASCCAPVVGTDGACCEPAASAR